MAHEKVEVEDPSSAGLSHYEVRRFRRMKANQQYLDGLGLKEDTATIAGPRHVKMPPSRTRTRKRALVTTAVRTLRRSTRHKRKVKQEHTSVKTEESGRGEGGDDYVLSESESDGDGDTGSEASLGIRLPRKVGRTRAAAIVSRGQRATASSSSATASSSVIRCELAKTGRSACRKCRVKLDKGAVRVGMTAWICGRQAVTWQHPACFLSLAQFTRDTSGRSKCKVSGARFQKGEARISCLSHKSTTNFRLDCFAAAFRSLVVVGGIRVIDTSTWPGHGDLTEEERVILKQQMHELLVPKVKAESTEGSATDGSEVSKDCKQEGACAGRSQPLLHKKTHTKGKVSWKWGSHICYGTLIASKETESHCYARTHKGNIKTLAKGKDYWCMAA